jgi:hypothetical protein
MVVVRLTICASVARGGPAIDGRQTITVWIVSE